VLSLLGVVVPDGRQLVRLLIVVLDNDNWCVFSDSVMNGERAAIDGIFEDGLGQGLLAGSLIDAVQVVDTERAMLALGAHYAASCWRMALRDSIQLKTSLLSQPTARLPSGMAFGKSLSE
jgi:hypothetical protein